MPLANRYTRSLLTLDIRHSAPVYLYIFIYIYLNYYGLFQGLPPFFHSHKLLLTNKIQVYYSYGDKSNDNLLQYYGFVELDNPHGEP